MTFFTSHRSHFGSRILTDTLLSCCVKVTVITMTFSFLEQVYGRLLMVSKASVFPLMTYELIKVIVSMTDPTLDKLYEETADALFLAKSNTWTPILESKIYALERILGNVLWGIYKDRLVMNLIRGKKKVVSRILHYPEIKKRFALSYTRYVPRWYTATQESISFLSEAMVLKDRVLKLKDLIAEKEREEDYLDWVKKKICYLNFPPEKRRAKIVGRRRISHR